MVKIFKKIQVSASKPFTVRFLSVSNQYLMWKTLNHGENVSVGDTLRYQSKSNSLLPESELYLVIKADQHYFEIIQKIANENTTESPRRKAVRYLDIGYNVFVERWAD